MPFDPKRLKVRRYEVQIHYDAAFLFWNTAGIIAEKWAHGPHFGAFAWEPERLTLTPEAGDNSRIGVCGLRASAFLQENPDAQIKDSEELAIEWLSDCTRVLQPRRHRRVYVKIVYSYRSRDRERLYEAVIKEYPGLRELPLSGYQEVHPGFNFQARSKDSDTEILTTAMFGAYGPDQARGMFQTHYESDDEWALGLVYDSNRILLSEHVDQRKALIQAMQASRRETWDLITRSIMRVASHV